MNYNDIMNGVYKDFFNKDADPSDPNYKVMADGLIEGLKKQASAAGGHLDDLKNSAADSELLEALRKQAAETTDILTSLRRQSSGTSDVPDTPQKQTSGTTDYSDSELDATFEAIRRRLYAGVPTDTSTPGTSSLSTGISGSADSGFTAKDGTGSSAPDADGTAAGSASSDAGGIASEKTAAEAAADIAAKDAVPETDPMEDLEALTGLTTIKKDVKELMSFVKTNKLRQEKGLKTVPVSLHLVFSGNPGTGKTTVARLIARLYKKIGVLSKGQLVEVDRSQLVAGYVGQTAIQTQKKIQEALGGVLFIDEAYTLAPGNSTGNDFGQEAIDTILKAMEDHRDDFVVIVAGYTDRMETFINSNPGLKSRFNKYFQFPDYTSDEMMEIFRRNCEKYQYTLTPEAETAVKEHLVLLEAEKGENFANARTVRNYFEFIVTNQARRVDKLEDPDLDALTAILPEDLTEEE